MEKGEKRGGGWPLQMGRGGKDRLKRLRGRGGVVLWKLGCVLSGTKKRKRERFPGRKVEQKHNTMRGKKTNRAASIVRAKRETGTIESPPPYSTGNLIPKDPGKPLSLYFAKKGKGKWHGQPRNILSPRNTRHKKIAPSPKKKGGEGDIVRIPLLGKRKGTLLCALVVKSR